jgi:hypothetical protein
MHRFLVPALVLLVAAGAEARPRGGTGSLQLNSMTTGAVVLIDGKEVGALPLAGAVELPVGQHTLKIMKRGYTEFLDVFTIARHKTTKLEIDLLPYAGILTVSSSVPGARVFIDGKFEGTTPVEREVLIGRRAIRVTKAGYYDFIASIKSIAGQDKALHAKLRLLPLGTTPYRPKPPPPAKWYEKWYVWAGAAGAVAVVAVAIAVPVTLANKNSIENWDPELRFFAGKK